MFNNTELIAAAHDWNADLVHQHSMSALDTIHGLQKALEDAEKTIKRLEKFEDWLVDNWEGYDDAQAIQRGEYDD